MFKYSFPLSIGASFFESQSTQTFYLAVKRNSLADAAAELNITQLL